MEEPNNCPKPDCGRPESTHRWSAGKKLSICGNGHTWDQQEVAERRSRAKEAEHQEVGVGIDYEVLRREYAEHIKHILDPYSLK